MYARVQEENKLRIKGINGLIKMLCEKNKKGIKNIKMEIVWYLCLTFSWATYPFKMRTLWILMIQCYGLWKIVSPLDPYSLTLTCPGNREMVEFSSFSFHLYYHLTFCLPNSSLGIPSRSSPHTPQGSVHLGLKMLVYGIFNDSLTYLLRSVRIIIILTNLSHDLSHSSSY